MINTTLCYIEQDGKYLMLHRIKKKEDINAGKWIGVGGKFEPGETADECVVREVFEETGLTLTVTGCLKPCYTTVGLTDESCATVFGTCEGTPNASGQEPTEDIQVVLADKKEARRILEEETLAIMCAYQLMRFLDAD